MCDPRVLESRGTRILRLLHALNHIPHLPPETWSCPAFDVALPGQIALKITFHSHSNPAQSLSPRTSVYCVSLVLTECLPSVQLPWPPRPRHVPWLPARTSSSALRPALSCWQAWISLLMLFRCVSLRHQAGCPSSTPKRVSTRTRQVTRIFTISIYADHLGT